MKRKICITVAAILVQWAASQTQANASPIVCSPSCTLATVLAIPTNTINGNGFVFSNFAVPFGANPALILVTPDFSHLNAAALTFTDLGSEWSVSGGPPGGSFATEIDYMVTAPGPLFSIDLDVTFGVVSAGGGPVTLAQAGVGVSLNGTPSMFIDNHVCGPAAECFGGEVGTQRIFSNVFGNGTTFFVADNIFGSYTRTTPGSNIAEVREFTQTFTAVPEPGTLMLMGSGMASLVAAGIGRLRRRRPAR
jgi:hypothetical protein